VDWLTQILDPAHIGAAFAQLEVDMQTPAFWLAVAQIIWINVLLSGDNALVIAMACRGLQPKQRLWGLILGAGVAVLLRIIFTGIVATLMSLPYLKIVGGLALIVIAAKLLVPQNEDEDDVAAASHLWAAVQVVAIADIVMSLDNVIAVAAAAKGSITLLVFGLAISIPMIVAGAALIMLLLNKAPILVWLGAALLGWIAGDVMATDPAIAPFVHRMSAEGGALAPLAAAFHNIGLNAEAAEIVCAMIGVIIVLALGTFWRKRALARHASASEAA
jgi:YjbE family integral membrane protein